MTVKRIHVNKHIIASNRKTGETKAPLSVKVGKRNVRGHRVEVLGKCTVIYRPEKPLSCGASVWVETHGQVNVDGEEV